VATIPDNTIFLSYRRKSAGVYVGPLASLLGEKLYNPGAAFYDKRTLRYGSKWWQEIVGAIDECRFFLPVITPDFRIERLFDKDDVLRKEFLRVGLRGADVTIVPVLIAGASPPDISKFSNDPELQAVIKRFHTDNGVQLTKEPEYWGSDLQRLCGEIANSFDENNLPGTPALPPAVEMYGCQINRLEQVAAVGSLAPRDVDEQSRPQLFLVRGGLNCGRWQFGSFCLHKLSGNNGLMRPHQIELSSFGNEQWSDEVRVKAILNEVWQKLGRDAHGSGQKIDSQLIRNELIANGQPQLFILSVGNKRGLRSINFSPIQQFFSVWDEIWHPDLNKLLSIVVFIEPHKLDFLTLKSFSAWIESQLEKERTVLNPVGAIETSHIDVWLNTRAEQGFESKTRRLLGFLDLPDCKSRLLGANATSTYDDIFDNFIQMYYDSQKD